MAVTLSAGARARLDKHLDAVEAALAAAGNSRERRRAVVDDLEAQLQEMLQARSATPRLEDVEAVLAKLDPPAAYREAGSAAAPVAAPPVASPGAVAAVPVGPRYSRTAIWGLVCILVSFLPPMALLPLGFFYGSATARPPTVSMQSHDTAPDRLSAIPAVPPPPPPAEAAPTTAATGEAAQVEAGPPRIVPVTSWGGLGKMLPCFACLIGPLGLLGTVLGWVAFGQIRRSSGALRGTGLALFDGLFYPVAGVLLLIVGLLFAA